MTFDNLAGLWASTKPSQRLGGWIQGSKWTTRNCIIIKRRLEPGEEESAEVGKKQSSREGRGGESSGLLSCRCSFLSLVGSCIPSDKPSGGT